MLEEKIESWYKAHGRKIIIVLGVLILLAIIIKLRILRLFAPFIVAWIFATLLNRVVTWANVKLKLHRGIGTILSMLTILSGVLWIIGIIVKKLWEQMINLTTRLPQITDEMVFQINQIESNLERTLRLFPVDDPLTNLDTLVEQLMDSMSSFLSSALPMAYDAVAKVPNIVLFIIAMLLATFFMTKDYYKIKAFVKAQFSDTIVDKIVIMQKGILEAIGGYVRTQVILMSVTFIICLTGLFIFGIDYALLLAVIIAIVDALPVFGSGTILIPWAVYNFLISNYSLAIGLLCIYGIIFMTRQVLEPKILSTQIGIYALVTVMAVYIGYQLIGVLGLIVGPALVVIVQMLQNVGVIPAFKLAKETKAEGDCDEKHISNKNKRSS